MSASQPFIPASPASGSHLHVRTNSQGSRGTVSAGREQALISPSTSLSRNTHWSSSHSLSDKFSLSPDLTTWTTQHDSEPDDYIHNPDPRRDRKNDQGGTIFTSRGLANLGCLILLVTGIIALFAGYPLIIYFKKNPVNRLGAFNLGGTNASGQVPDMSGNWGLIDADTPHSAYNKKGDDGSEMELVFSDEFNTPGRSFYPGDDPYWEAADLHYWQTNNMEWYDPSALTTENGYLKITLSQTENHELDYMGGLLSSWNKFCFTGGRIEAAVTLPGTTSVGGLWPAVWTMGNLGRAGFGASLEGVWPYSYDTCDVGTLANQTKDGLPVAALVNGDEGQGGGALSFLPGQRLSACTCPGESHPGPLKSDGTLTGRAAPEIDIFEGQVDTARAAGTVSQSGQWAPMNHGYIWDNSSANIDIYDPSISIYNTYTGGIYQQATSVVSDTDQNCYSQSGTGCFSVYGFEYRPGVDNAYITWISNDKPAWTLRAAGMGRDPIVEIAQRPIPQEPMYIIANLGISTNFGAVDTEHLTFPVSMHIDWIRVYQRKGERNIGCDPPAFPTAKYIDTYLEAYTNPNLTTWSQFKQKMPKNKLIDQC